jgi:large exoprotein involved in heme utilization and adhesion
VVFSLLELAPDLRVDSVARLGRIALAQGAFLDVSGNGGGTVLLRGDSLRMDAAAIFADNRGTVDGMGLGVDVWMAGDAVITNESFITTRSYSAGRARNLQLQVGTLTLTGNSRIASTAQGPGHGGQLTVTATEAVTIAGVRSGLLGNTRGSGDAGDLFVSAPLLTLDGSFIQAVADQGSRGHAGAVEVRVGRLTLTGGAQIGSFTWGPEHGGPLTVTATEAVTITGRRLQAGGLIARSGLFSSTLSSGDAGRLVVSTPTLQLMDAGVISAATLGEGNAGDIEVQVERLSLTGGGQIFTGVGVPTSRGPENSGRGGTLMVTATESIVIAGRDDTDLPSGLASAAFVGKGESGDLRVSTPLLDMRDGGRIEAGTFSASSGPAGDIDVHVGRLTLTGGAQIASSTRSAGRGGG